MRTIKDSVLRLHELTSKVSAHGNLTFCLDLTKNPDQYILEKWITILEGVENV